MNRRPVRIAKRIAAVCSVAFACAAAPVYADDPLLSGYSAPGGGEQVVIGSSVLPPKNGNGSIRSGATAANAPTAPSAVAPSGSGGGSTSSGTQNPAQQQQPDSQVPAVAAKPTYPNTVSSASGLPLSSRDLILIAAAALSMLAVGLGVMRLKQA